MRVTGGRVTGEEAKAWMTARLLVAASGGWRCHWSLETGTLKRGGKREGETYSRAGVPYLNR